MLAEQGTLVVSVHPGPIATDMAQTAGLADVAEPPSLVADGIIAALADAQFHCFPDKMARDVWRVFETFGRGVVERDLDE